MTYVYRAGGPAMLTLAVLLALALAVPARAAAATNLVPDPSMETAASNWLFSSWGTNNAAGSLVSDAHTGSAAGQVTATSYTSGDAKWMSARPIPVTAGKTYTASVWYKTTVLTDVEAMPYNASGAEMSAQDQWVADAPVCQTYCQASGTFTVPAGAAGVKLMVPLAKVGTVKTDDYSLTTGGVPSGFAQGIVSVTIDDGWSSAYTKARSILNTNKIPATFFIVSSFIGDTPDYMTATQIKTLARENGNEIGNHTVDHTDLTTLGSTAATTEFTSAQTTINSQIGVKPTTCAYPYGAYNTATTTAGGSLNVIPIAKGTFKACRSTDGGFNYPSNFASDPTLPWRVMDYNIDSTTTVAAVKQAIDEAKQFHAWLVLTYHEVGESRGGDQYNTSTANFSSEMQYLRNSGVKIETFGAAAADVAAQLAG